MEDMKKIYNFINDNAKKICRIEVGESIFNNECIFKNIDDIKLTVDEDILYLKIYSRNLEIGEVPIDFGSVLYVQEVENLFNICFKVSNVSRASIKLCKKL